MRAIITGSRECTNQEMVFEALDYVHQHLFNITVLIQGGCKGTDRLAKKWANENNITCVTLEADWDKYGRAAGPIRNREMCETFKEDSTLIAFPGGRGTASCVQEAKRVSIPVLFIEG